MANKVVFKKDNAGIRRLLQSQDCMKIMEGYARKRAVEGSELNPFIGFDRAKVFIKERK